jgi:hypothetical protein
MPRQPRGGQIGSDVRRDEKLAEFEAKPKVGSRFAETPSPN